MVSSPTVDPHLNLYEVNVNPEINRVEVGKTATFECGVQLTDQDNPIRSFTWVASNVIAKENRFSFDNNQRILHIDDVKTYDNNTNVECIVTMDTGARLGAFGHIVVLPKSTSPLFPPTETSAPTVSTVSESLPAPAGLNWVTGVIAGALSGVFLLIIIALLAYVCHLKRRTKKRKWSALLTPTVTGSPTVGYHHESDGVSVQYAKPHIHRDRDRSHLDSYNSSIMSSVFQYDIPRSSSVPMSPDVIPNHPPAPSPIGHAKLYKQKSHNPAYLQHNSSNLQKSLRHHQSMPSLNDNRKSGRLPSRDGYEDMESGRLSVISRTRSDMRTPSTSTSRLSHPYDNISRSYVNLSSSHNHLDVPQNSYRSSFHQSSWSVASARSYENIASSDSPAYQNTPDFVAYHNQPMQRAPSFEIIDGAEDHNRNQRRLNYASLHLEDSDASPAPSQDSLDTKRTNYAKIRGIIKVFRTKRSTRVNIVNH